MNENIDLTKILKDCPIGWELYSSIYGNVNFRRIENSTDCPIVFFFIDKEGITMQRSVTNQGLDVPWCDGECTLFPSKEQRDWSKFTAPWYKKDKFDPNTLKTFDKVLVRTNSDTIWEPDFFGYMDGNWVMCISTGNVQCVPYNDDNKHLLGTTEEAPEYYRYWEE